MAAGSGSKRSKPAGEVMPAETEFRANGRRPTSYDVALRAGVSQSAVSRCYSPNASIAPATRERIILAANELGYSPNALAQALISRRTNLVAVLISSLTMLYYPEVLAELTERLTVRNIRVLLFSLHAEGEVDDVLDQVWRHSVDGVICAARLSDEQIQMFEDRHVPLVLYNRVSGTASAASVCCDSVAGERDLIGKLLAAGHKKFGIIAGPQDSYVGEERRETASETLRQSGILDVPVVRGDFSYESGSTGLQALMANDASFDAVVCVSDQMAIGAIDAGREVFRLRIPEDLSVVGFDGSGPATWSSYQVTSVRQPVQRMTEAAVTMLVERIEDASLPAERRLFTGQFIIGRSARMA